MNFKELEFSADDFEDLECSKETSGQIPSWDARIISEQANRLLRERLEKAPEVCGRYDVDSKLFIQRPEPSKWTHKARLVCIEEHNSFTIVKYP